VCGRLADGWGNGVQPNRKSLVEGLDRPLPRSTKKDRANYKHIHGRPCDEGHDDHHLVNPGQFGWSCGFLARVTCHDGPQRDPWRRRRAETPVGPDAAFWRSSLAHFYSGAPMQFLFGIDTGNPFGAILQSSGCARVCQLGARAGVLAALPRRSPAPSKKSPADGAGPG
jgi:hypothetical protein